MAEGVIIEDPGLMYSKGRGRWSRQFVFGVNENVGNALEDVWAVGGAYPWPETAGTVSIVSTDANDTSAGTGLQTLRLVGLDADGVEISETVTLNGVTPVVTSATFWRVSFMQALVVGAYGGVNAGTITATLDGSVVCQIKIGEGRSRLGLFTVPAGCNWHLKGLTFSSQGKPSDFRLWVRPNSNTTSAAPFQSVRTVGRINAVEAPVKLERFTTNSFGPLTDVSARAVTAGGSGLVTVMYELIVERIYS